MYICCVSYAHVQCQDPGSTLKYPLLIVESLGSNENTVPSKGQRQDMTRQDISKYCHGQSDPTCWHGISIWKSLQIAELYSNLHLRCTSASNSKGVEFCRLAFLCFLVLQACFRLVLRACCADLSDTVVLQTGLKDYVIASVGLFLLKL